MEYFRIKKKRLPFLLKMVGIEVNRNIFTSDTCMRWKCNTYQFSHQMSINFTCKITFANHQLSNATVYASQPRQRYYKITPPDLESKSAEHPNFLSSRLWSTDVQPAVDVLSKRVTPTFYHCILRSFLRTAVFCNRCSYRHA